MSSKRTLLNVGITSFNGKISLTFLFLLFSGNCFASAAGGGACPANVPVTGCYFIAANGSDTNNGTSEATPWLHAPGMPNCSSNCAALSAGNGGIGLIFRGRDTWHEGNSGASPYTGGAWDLYGWFSNAYNTNISNCVYEGNQTGCLYAGVDPNWFSGGSWTRPIITGDNPTLAGAGNYVSSCQYQTSSADFGPNALVVMPGYTILDNFEVTGLCSSASSTSSGQTMITGFATSGNFTTESTLKNVYLHGWTATSGAGAGSGSHPVTVISGGGGAQQIFDHIVIDGQDSNPTVAAWGAFPNFKHVVDSMFRYVGQGVGQGCHDIHDNIFEHFYMTVRDGHYNMLECNSDASLGTPNVIYNNVVRHFDPGFSSGEVWWVCPNTTPEYWFNNTMYDLPGGKAWAYAGALQYPGCTNTGGQFMFNNTIVDAPQLCNPQGSTVSGGIYLTVLNEHLINSPWDDLTSDAQKCTGRSDASNIAMSDATATSQGYTTGTAGTVQPNNCANDSTKPCTPTAAGNGTVGTGGNHQAYCTTLASNTSDPAIGTDAANACKNGATDGCSYNTSTHSMNCSSQTAVLRSTSGAWDSGAYVYNNQGPPPMPPSNLSGVVR